MTDLFKAAADNDLAAIVRAVRNELQDVNAQHPRAGTIPLQLACQGDALQAVELLIKLGADPQRLFTRTSRVDGTISTDHFPLLYAVSPAVAEVLIAAGADINASSGEGATALSMAVQLGNVAMCEYLLSRGARTDTELHWLGEKMSLVSFVLRYRDYFIQAGGADPNAETKAMIENLDRIRAVLFQT